MMIKPNLLQFINVFGDKIDCWLLKADIENEMKYYLKSKGKRFHENANTYK